MNVQTRRAAGKLLFLAIALWTVPAWAADPALGTWKLKVEKSRFSPGPPPRSGLVTYEETEAGVKRTGQLIEADGAVISLEYTARYDGQDYAVQGSSQFTAVSLEQIDDRTVDAKFKKGGTVVATGRRTVSRDGDTLTIELTGSDARGAKVHNVFVYERDGGQNP